MNSIKKIRENEIVYSSLRNEILLVEEMQRNMYLYMYSIFAVLYALGVQFGHIFFLVCFVVLIPFQSKINFYSWSITKISVYIRVFFEETRNDIHWESFQTYPAYMRASKNKNASVFGALGHSGTALLGCLASASFTFGEISAMPSNPSASQVIISFLLILFAFALAILSFIVAKQSLKRTDAETFILVDQYRSDIESGHSSKEYRLK